MANVKGNYTKKQMEEAIQGRLVDLNVNVVKFKKFKSVDKDKYTAESVTVNLEDLVTPDGDITVSTVKCELEEALRDYNVDCSGFFIEI